MKWIRKKKKASNVRDKKIKHLVSYRQTFDFLYHSKLITKFLNYFIRHGRKKSQVWQLYKNLLFIFKTNSLLFHQSLYFIFRAYQLPFLVKPYIYRGLRSQKKINYWIQRKLFLYQFNSFLIFRKAVLNRPEQSFFMRVVSEYRDMLIKNSGLSRSYLMEMLNNLKLARRKLVEIIEKERVIIKAKKKKPRVRYRWFLIYPIKQKLRYRNLVKK